MRLLTEGANFPVPEDAEGRIEIVGCVLDGDRAPIGDALIELWQANPSGRYRHPDDRRDEVPVSPDFTGFGRAVTDERTGEFRFVTLRPGRVPHPDGRAQAPHLNLIVQARGMLNPSFTRLYFPDDDNADDPVLASIADGRRPTLIAERVAGEVPTYRFDIRFQDEDETVFLDF